MDIPNIWLQAKTSALIRGARLSPMEHPKNNIVYCEKGQQGIAYHLIQKSTNREWILKKFHPHMQPDTPYLLAIRNLAPQGITFASATRRVVLTSKDIKEGENLYYTGELSKWLEGSILMQKADGISWKQIVKEIHRGTLELSAEKRINFAKNLAETIHILANEGCSHRDLCHDNLYLDLQEYVVYLVDWDSMFHESLYFHRNTPVGTSGYIAPWIFSSGEWNAQKTWNQFADRFSLSILIAELLLIDQNTNHQEGLFAQEMFLNPRHNYVAQVMDSLYQMSEHLGDLFQQTITATSYQECPAPIDWLDALTEIEVFEDSAEETMATMHESKIRKEIFSTPKLSRPKDKWGYFFLAMFILVPLAFLIVYKTQQKNYFTENIPPIKTVETPNKIPVSNVDSKSASNLVGTQQQARKFLISIFYADNDLKLIVGNRQVQLDKANSAWVNLKPGTYKVTLTFTAVTFHDDGSEEYIGPVTYSRDIIFDKKQRLYIRINRVEKTWKLEKS